MSLLRSSNVCCVDVATNIPLLRTCDPVTSTDLFVLIWARFNGTPHHRNISFDPRRIVSRRAAVLIRASNRLSNAMRLV